MDRFVPLEGHFNRYLMIGGFPELVLSDDDMYAQRMLREDVVDKVIKRDVLTLFNIRSPLLMEKLFLYLCMNSTEIFSVTTAAKELENTSAATIDSYIEALEMSNLIYLSKPMDVGSKGALKGKPKIYIADAAIRNAVLMIDDVLSDERELGAMVETTVYKHIVSFYQGSTAQLGYFRKAKDNQKEVDVVIELPREKILCEVKYRNNSHIPATDAIVDSARMKVQRSQAHFLSRNSWMISALQSTKPMCRFCECLPLHFCICWGKRRPTDKTEKCNTYGTMPACHNRRAFFCQLD